MRRFISALSHGFRVLVLAAAILAVLWLIIYRFLLAFTPLWLDLLSLGAGGIGMLLLVLLGRSHQRPTGGHSQESK